MEDEAALAFFANLDEQNAKVDEGAEDFFANLNQVNQAAPVQLKPTATANYNPLLHPSHSASGLHAAAKGNNQTGRQDKKKRKFQAEAKRMEEQNIPTDQRIVGLLVPNMTVEEVMQMVRKIRQAGKSDADEFSAQDGDRKIAPRFICEYCGNTEQHNFITDYARGDTICKGKDGSGCGTVVQDHIVHEGSAYRKFEGEEDKSHHGPAPNKLFSAYHNLRTHISLEGTEGANLRRAQEFVEKNLSQMGKDDRRTRIGYKDEMKKKACSLIDHVASNLDLHEIVVARSKEMFAEFRDLREHVHQFEAVVAGCILASYIDTGKEMYTAQNKHRMKPLAQEKPIDEKALHPFTCPYCGTTYNAKRGLQFHNCEMRPDEKMSTKEKTEDLKPIDIPDEMKPISEIRNGKKWFKCPICPKQFQQLAKIEEHIKRHANQSKKRKTHMDLHTVDTTRLTKTRLLASANPSVQVNVHEQVLFRGGGRRPWLQQLQKESEI